MVGGSKMIPGLVWLAKVRFCLLCFIFLVIFVSYFFFGLVLLGLVRLS